GKPAPVSNPARKPPHGSVSPRTNTTRLTMLRIGRAILEKLRKEMELSSALDNGDVSSVLALRTGVGAREANKVATATPATPSTESAPRVSTARNATRITLTKLMPPVTTVPYRVKYRDGTDMCSRSIIVYD